jgi:hypothetical protein
VLNGQCIDIAEEKKSTGSKVIQYEKTGGTNHSGNLCHAELKYGK